MRDVERPKKCLPVPFSAVRGFQMEIKYRSEVERNLSIGINLSCIFADNMLK